MSEQARDHMQNPLDRLEDWDDFVESRYPEETETPEHRAKPTMNIGITQHRRLRPGIYRLNHDSDLRFCQAKGKRTCPEQM